MKVGIVIPCRNERNYIAKCLLSIAGQSYSGTILTFVCDGMSDDGTLDEVKKLQALHSGIHLIENLKRTTPFALNLGISEALQQKCELIIILGAHSELNTDYVEQCVKKMSELPDVSCVGGVLENVYENKSSELIGRAMSSPFGVGNAHFRTGTFEGYVDTVAFGAYRAEVFEKIGLFDEELVRNQDDEFNYRLTKAGGKIYLSHAIRCKYYVRASYKKLYRQYKQYGYWKVYVGKKHKAVTTVRQLIPFAFVMFLIVGTILSFLVPYFCWLFAGGLFLYFVLALYFAVKVSKDLTGVLPVIAVFLILHIAYGTGYQMGILDFLIFGKSIKKEEKSSR